MSLHAPSPVVFPNRQHRDGQLTFLPGGPRRFTTRTAATKPIVAKIADASGRAEALSVSLVSIVLGFAINAASRNMGTMAAGHVFYSFGQVGIVFLQQILAADTTTLENRSVFGALLYSPPIFTAWIGGPMVQALVPAHWRWYVLKI